jgi:predicted TIM-barrel fold metal-dependent hydrolase
MSDSTSVFDSEFPGPPNKRRVQAERDLVLPAGTEVFSADTHISVTEDIWYQRFPAAMKDRAPRVWWINGVPTIGIGGKSFLPEGFLAVVEHYGDMPGMSASNIEARMADLDAEGIVGELAFPNELLVLLGYPDFEARELCFRIYNEYIAELQARAPGRFYGVGVINWWDAKGARRTLGELKALGLKTYWLPLHPGKDADGKPIDFASSAMTPVWEAIEEAGLPVAHHIGEGGPQYPCQFNGVAVGMLHQVAPFREMFGKYIFGGILDRHKSLRIGWFEGGINWVVSAIQDAEHVYASFRHMNNLTIEHEVPYYWQKHMVSSFVIDPLGLELIDKIGVDRVMWSTDYPHNESTFGYSRKSLKQAIDLVGPEATPQVVGGNVKRFLGI